MLSVTLHAYTASLRKLFISIIERQVSPIKVNVTPKSLRIAEGSSALFLCTANTVFITYTRSWTKDGYRLLPQNAKVFDGTLAFHNAKRSDSGVYTCSASNQLSVDSATVVLSVGGKILLTFILKWQKLGLLRGQQGDAVQLEICV